MYPGVGLSSALVAFANKFRSIFSRIQFTPGLMHVPFAGLTFKRVSVQIMVIYLLLRCAIPERKRAMPKPAAGNQKTDILWIRCNKICVVLVEIILFCIIIVREIIGIGQSRSQDPLES